MNSGAAQLELDADIPDTHVHPAWATLKRLFRHRLFVCGLCGEAGIVPPTRPSYTDRDRLVVEASRLLYETVRYDTQAETASDVLLTSAEKLNTGK